MSRILLLIFLTAVAAGASWSQEQPAGSDDEPSAGEVADSAADAEPTTDEPAEEEIDDTDLDEQTYEEDEDDFVPTEEIPSDEPIPFPSNI